MKGRLIAFASFVLLATLVVGLIGFAAKRNGEAAMAPVSGFLVPAEATTASSSAELDIHTSTGSTGGATGEAPETLPLAPSANGIAEAAPTSTAAFSDSPATGAASSSSNTGTSYQQPYESGLTAGQVDDNAGFSNYLDYLRNFTSGSVLPLDVSQRLFMRVMDGSQQAVAGARVQLFDGDRQVFDGKTMSDGRVLFFPSLVGETQATQFRAVISRGQTSVQTTVKPGGSEQAVALAGVKDNSGAVGIDLVFLLDATGSMGDEIDKIKGTMGSIAQRIEQLPGSSAPRFGLVAFRDRGDDYVTRSWDFTSDVDQFSANLSNVQAGGGGDIPESVSAGLHDAIHLPGWADDSTGRRLRMIVLVGDAPPHIDYANDYSYPDLLQEAVAAGIKIFPVGASDIDPDGEYVFRQFAEVTQGKFVFLTYANGVSGAPGVSTDMHVGSNFSVENLDTLVVSLVAGEVANQTGQQSGLADPQLPIVEVPVAAPVPVALPAPPRPVRSGLSALADDFMQGKGGAFWAAMLLLIGGVVFATRKQVAARVASSQSQEIYIPEGGAHLDQLSLPEQSDEEERAILAAHLQPEARPVEVRLDVQPAGEPTAPLGR